MKGKEIARAACVVFCTAAVVLGGRREVEAEYTEQPAWHMIDALSSENGVAVKIAGENLMLHRGVRVYADSEESPDFPAGRVRDGITVESGRGGKSARWSSDNDWEDNEHWLEVDFGGERTIGFVRIHWERMNASSYTLEYSEDGKRWTAAASFSKPPEENRQDIFLEEPVRARRLRLHVTDVTKAEEDLSLYYQNISVLELEVYEGIADTVFVEQPEIESGLNRKLELPGVPEGYQVEFAGADYDMLVEPDGTIADNLTPVEAELGFALIRDGVRWELPGMMTRIPASRPVLSEGEKLPDGFDVCEWLSLGGDYQLSEETRIAVPGEQEAELMPAAVLFAKELGKYMGRRISVYATDVQSGMSENDILLSCVRENASNAAADGSEPTGGEGYEIRLNSTDTGGTRIYAKTPQGVRWGCVSLLSLLEKSGGRLPRGIIRDYPKCEVRGFGIDVGRRPVSLGLLYRIVEEMSAHKMNTLLVHLNDNEIITQSGYDGTVKGALGLYAGFRLESSLKNERGERLTSTDLYYTKAEFEQFIQTAKAYGVAVVPEIDTPAHSLAFTRLFPELGLTKNAESADQLDLSRPGARKMIREVWSEYLLPDGAPRDGKDAGDGEKGGGAVFGACSAVHIGMDEYFGSEKAYLSWLGELSAHVRSLAPDKAIRIWGSLSKIEDGCSDVPRDLQMHIWDTEWADPLEMYEEGFSIINSLSSSLYIIPGGGYDYLDEGFLENEWRPNVFHTKERTWELPAFSPKMLGACYMMWNDWHQVSGEEITEDGLFDRFERPLPLIAGKLWGAQRQRNEG